MLWVACLELQMHEELGCWAYSMQILCVIFPQRSELLLLFFIWKLASLESPTIEIPCQPMLKSSREVGRPEGLCALNGNLIPQILWVEGKRARGFGIAVGNLVFCGSVLGCERHPILWIHSPILGVIFCYNLEQKIYGQKEFPSPIVISHFLLKDK